MARYRPSRKAAFLSADSSSFSSDVEPGLESKEEAEEEDKRDRKSHGYGSTKNYRIL